jgi:hypothetical protein
MKPLLFFLAVVLSINLTSCKVGKGCPSNGRNIGAERVLSGDPKTMKDLKKAGKFRGGGNY